MPLSLEDAKIRLEGAYERLERTRDDLRETAAAIGKPRWRTALTHPPGRLTALAEAIDALGADAERSRALLRHDACPGLKRLLHEVLSARSGVEASVRARVGSELPLAEGLRALEQKVLAELPAPLAPDEEVVVAGGFSRASLKGILRTLVGLSWLPVGAAVLLSKVATPGVTVLVAGVLASSVIAVAIAFERRGFHRYTLTTRRLIHEPAHADARDVRLEAIPDAGVRLTGVLDAVDIPSRGVALPGVTNPRELAARIELERWLSQRPDASPPSRSAPFERAVIPIIVSTGRSASLAGYFVLRPEFVAWVATDDLRYGFGHVVGTAPACAIPVRVFVDALARLPERTADDVLLAVLAPGFAPVFRRAECTVRADKVWGSVFLERGDERRELGPLDFNARQDVERLLSTWTWTPPRSEATPAVAR